MTRKTNRRDFVRAAGLTASGLIVGAAPLATAAQAQTRATPRTMGARFRALMNAADPLICPGAYDLMSARLCEVHGFKAVFVGSSAANQELVGLPDQAVVTVSEIIDYNSVIAANVDIPILADVDDFGATPLNVYRFAKQADRAGIGCAAFDDRMPINRATAYTVPGVFPKARMIDNIHAAADARMDMVLIARCLAPTPNNSYTEMLDRAAAYAEAGADAVWIGLPTANDYVKAAGIVKKPLMAVVGNANFPATVEAMKAARISVGQSATMMGIALGAVDKALTELKATGRMTEAQKGTLNRATTDKVEQVEELNQRSRKYNLPSASGPER
ncbi:MAG TPA: isocitrate lyase/PEP mutase family protein [Vicinamibacterales bacterium]|jgi:methylisocitrate lyase|nr:isocitrate lyase/PEP mutase family protein [Vicinamibacterales bacterium]